MNRERKKRLIKTGWKAGTAREFLGLSREESELVQMRIALSECLKRQRLKSKLTQQDLAKQLGSSQSRVAKLEAGAPGVTLDLLFRALFAAGATTEVIAREIRLAKRKAA